MNLHPIPSEFLTYENKFLLFISVQCNTVPSNLLISSGAINFVTPTANFCAHLLGLFYQISKNFKKYSQIFFSFDVALCQKVINITFFKDLYFVKFCDEINFANFRKSPRKRQQGGILQYSYSDEKFI
jgi:hypothetical protein